MRKFFWIWVLALAGAANAWIDTGHMVVAKIAEAQLKPGVREKAAKLAAMMSTPKIQSFTELSCYADDFKSNKDRHWHYIDFPFRTDGKPPKGEPPLENVVWAIRRYTEVLKKKTGPERDRAEALMYLTHFVGDVHQPCHTLTRQCDEHPDGDRGSNLFEIKPIADWSNRPVKNLHIAWDFGLGEFPAVPRPLDKTGSEAIRAISDRIMKEFPQSKLKSVKEKDPNAWAKETFKLGPDVYRGLEERAALPADYLNRSRTTCRKQAALAGYRLANLLNECLK